MFDQSRAIRLGLDIDGTITLDPPLFARISKSCRAIGGEVHIVTSRSEQARAETLDELEALGIEFDEIFFLPSMSAAQELCPHASLDWFQRYLWQKVSYAKRHRLTHFVDDDLKVLSLFANYASDIAIFSATDRMKLAASVQG